MLTKATLESSQAADAGVEHRQRLRQRLLDAALPVIDRLVDTLLEAPDRELFRSVETQARELGQQLAAAAQQAGLDDRKKGGM